MLAVRTPEAELVVVRLLVELARIERAVGALLQLDRVRAALLRRVDQPSRPLDVALMVVADLRDDVALAVVADLDAVDCQLPAHRRFMLVACSRSRARSVSTRRCTRFVKSTSGCQPSRPRAREASPTSRWSSAGPRCSSGSTRTYSCQSSPTYANAHCTSSRTE